MAVSIIICYGEPASGKTEWAKKKGLEIIHVDRIVKADLNNIIDRIRFYLSEKINMCFALEHSKDDLTSLKFLIDKLNDLDCATSYRCFQRDRND